MVIRQPNELNYSSSYADPSIWLSLIHGFEQRLSIFFLMKSQWELGKFLDQDCLIEIIHEMNL